MALLEAFGGYGRRDLLTFLVERAIELEDDLRQLHGDETPSTDAIWSRVIRWARRAPMTPSQTG